MLKTEIIVRNYNPETDYPGTVVCMQNLGFFREGQDTAERMRRIVDNTPNAIRVANFAGNQAIEACLHIPDSLIPIVCRQGISPTFPRPAQLMNVMLNDATRILIDRGADWMEDLVDVDRPLPDMSESPALAAVEAQGFRAAYSLVGTVRDFWQLDGEPVPDLPVGDMFTVRTE